MNKIYRRCKVFINKESLTRCHFEVACYALAYEFGLSEDLAEKIFLSVQNNKS